MSAFSIAEVYGRKCWSAQFPNYNNDFSTGTYDWWDVSGYTSNQTTALRTSQPFIAEIKVRENITHDKYSNGVMLEVKKYDNLINYTLQSGIPSFYFCVYDDKTLVANLANIDLKKVEQKTMLLPKFTKDESAGYELKPVYLVPKKFFKIINSGSTHYNKIIND